MLVKITCVSVVVLLVLASVVGYEDDGDEARQEYPAEDDNDSYGSYQQGNNEHSDAARVKRFKNKPSIKTLSPEELQEVRGAINKILSGHNQDNPFTPLPSAQESNYKRPKSDHRAAQKPRSVEQSDENYVFNPRTKFNEYTDVTDNTKSETQTSIKEPLTIDNVFKASTLTVDEEYDTDSNNDYIGATINALSSLYVIPSTHDVNSDITSFTTAELVPKDATAITETITFETESNSELTGATVNAWPTSSLSSIKNIDTNDIKSEISNILGGIYKNENNIASNRAVTDKKHKNEIVGVTIMDLPMRSRLSNLRTEENEIVTVDQERPQEEITMAEPEAATPEVTEAVTEIATEVVQEATTEAATEAAPAAVQEYSTDTATQSHLPHVTGLDVGEPESVLEAVTKDQNAFEQAVNEEFTVPSIPNQGFENFTVPPTLLSILQNITIIPNITIISNITDTSTNKPTTRSRTRRKTTTKFQLDVPALLAIIANLTYDYEMNLTDNLNATLLKYSIPTCETPTTTAKKGIFIDYDANATGTIIAKCFVCGLEVEEIPRHAHCADAFAGDFLPLVPVDMTARGKISKYRKYCRYADVPHYMVNETQPRSVFGRWSGGCSVRWIDLSGVYTQRSCRNRERAIMGRHFASKRMAKLEMALGNVENGCITSPMATLVPLSRGISLYARFHACVCTGSWCNSADLSIPWTAGSLLPLLVTYISPRLLI